MSATRAPMSDGVALFGLRFFAVSIALATAMLVVAPVPFIRLLGAVALGCAVCGFLLHLYAVRAGASRAARPASREWTPMHVAPASVPRPELAPVPLRIPAHAAADD